MTRALGVLMLLFISGSGIAAERFQLELPVGCQVGTSCFIQKYPDNDPGPGARDYRCGPQTNDGHKGTDFRLRTTADAQRGVSVLAAAGGVVARVRDGLADRLVRDATDDQAVKDRECGNGIVIEHEAGWQTQYCHLRRNSVRVSPGQRVVTGQPIGEIGYSGAAGFAHLHLTVRRNGRVVDPFLGPDGPTGSCALSDGNLWSQAARPQLDYVEGLVLDAGFAPGAPELPDLETGTLTGETIVGDAPALVAWGWAINLRKADRVAVVLKGPDGLIARASKVLDADKAQYFLFAGKKRPTDGWPAGRYVALFGVLRNGVEVLRAGRAFTRP